MLTKMSLGTVAGEETTLPKLTRLFSWVPGTAVCTTVVTGPIRRSFVDAADNDPRISATWGAFEFPVKLLGISGFEENRGGPNIRM